MPATSHKQSATASDVCTAVRRAVLSSISFGTNALLKPRHFGMECLQQGDTNESE